MLRLNIFLAIGYFLGGYLGALIAIPPSHASPIWPAAGIALADLYVYGRAAIPGLWLGAFVTQTYAFLDTSNSENLSSSLMIGAIAGTAATAQAMLGAWLVRRHVGINNALIDDRSILRFMALGGLLGCLVSASSGMLTLYLKGVISPDNIAFGWLTWWIGDVIGVLIFTPLALCFIGAPKPQWRSRISSVALPLVILLVLVFTLFRLGKYQEQTRISELFEERVSLLHNALQNEFTRHIEINQSIKALFDSSTAVTPNDFKTFIQPILSSHPDILALQWIPRITEYNRPEYDRLLGHPLTILAFNNKQELIPAPQRNEYFPIVYIEPYRSNERTFGVDISTEPTMHKAVQLATDTAKSIATEMIYLVQDAKKRSGIIVFTPVYRSPQPHTTEQRRLSLRGFASSVFFVDNEVNEVKKDFESLQLLVKITDADVELFNNTTPASNFQLNFPKLEKVINLQVANRTWKVTYIAAQQFYSEQISWNIWWLILGGFLFTGLTGIGLLMLTGRTMQTEGLVKIRTRELDKVIQQHNDHNKVLQAIASSMTLPEILDLIVKTTEQSNPDTLCAILLLNQPGQHLITTPSLHGRYSPAGETAIGNYGASPDAWEHIVVEDIRQHPDWRHFADQAEKAGLSAFRSEPIFSSTQQVLGSFLVYHRSPKYQDTALINEISDLVQLASIAIERKRSEEDIIHLAFFDALTDLPNRRLFSNHLENALSRALRHHANGALLYLDLDHFKTLNDSLGHDFGDELLIQVSNRLQACIHGEDTVARLGGDEFVLLLNRRNITRDIMLEEALTMAEQVQAALLAPYQLKGHTHHITTSIGITLIPQLNTSSGELLKQADTAMYHAKNRGRNSISFYDENMQRRADYRLMLEKDLHNALSKQQFFLYYQPQFDADRHLIGAEALLRWLHPEKGMIPPVDFIPVAEETTLILSIGEWVLKEACLQLQMWPGLPHLAVNISPKQFHQPKLESQIADILTNCCLTSPRLMIEITEGSVFKDMTDSIAKLQAMQNLGIDISIDDFGTGYSSLAYLKMLPLNQLKIDQSFVRDICTDSTDAAIVETIIVMAKHLGLSVLAEGVETVEQFQFLQAKGCDAYQGYFFSEPLTADEFTEQYMRDKNRV